MNTAGHESIHFKCPRCSREIIADARAAGILVQCPECTLRSRIPAVEEIGATGTSAELPDEVSESGVCDAIPRALAGQRRLRMLRAAATVAALIAGITWAIFLFKGGCHEQPGKVGPSDLLSHSQGGVLTSNSVLRAQRGETCIAQKGRSDTRGPGGSDEEAQTLAMRTDADEAEEIGALSETAGSLVGQGDIAAARAIVMRAERRFGRTPDVENLERGFRRMCQEVADRQEAMAESLASLGAYEDAVAVSEDLIEDFAESSAAKKARSNIQFWRRGVPKRPIRSVAYTDLTDQQRDVVVESIVGGLAVRIDRHDLACPEGIERLSSLLRSTRADEIPLRDVAGPTESVQSEDFDEDMKHGDRRYIVLYRRTGACEECAGQGHKRYGAGRLMRVKCKECGGRGRTAGFRKCSQCSGSGKVTCSACFGKGVRYVGGKLAHKPIGQARVPKGYTVCQKCRRTGKIPCAACRGSGQMSGEKKCSKCGGDGQIEARGCEACNGRGTLEKLEALLVSGGRRL